jgi:hypothetical protein
MLSASPHNVHIEYAPSSLSRIKQESDAGLTPNRNLFKEKKSHSSGSCTSLLSYLQSNISVSDRLSSIAISPRSTQNGEVSGSELEYSVGDPMDSDSSPASIEEEDIFGVGASVDRSQHQPLDQTSRFSQHSPTKGLLERLTPEGEADFFYEFYHTLDYSFGVWERSVGYARGKTRELDRTNPNDVTLDLPSRIEQHIIFGQRPDRNGFWRGYLRLGGKYTELVKLTSWTAEEKVMWGVEIGKIDDFECLDGATLFFAIDRKVYYTDCLRSF